jgi:hypothetical protein
LSLNKKKDHITEKAMEPAGIYTVFVILVLVIYTLIYKVATMDYRLRELEKKNKT